MRPNSSTRLLVFRGVFPALALLLPAAAAAQTTTPPAAEAPAVVVFAGRVLDRATGQPIPGAQVEFPVEAKRALSDSTGAFRVEPLTAGNHDLVVFARGYNPVAVTVALREGMPSVDVPLAPTTLDSTARVEFAGQVVDAKTGRPLRDARVEFVGPGRAVLTDAEGVFRLAPVEPGPQMLRVRAAGYPTLASLVAVEPGMGPAMIRIEPDVVLLAGLEVIADRMERRRSAAGVSSRVASGTVLTTSSTGDMKAFVRQHFGLQESVCGAIGTAGGSGCIIARGTPIVPTIIVDDVPQFGDITLLEAFDPDDFDRVEVYGGGRTILLYTTSYMERQARSKNPPLPFPIND